MWIMSKKKIKYKDKMTKRYRFLIIDDTTYEEKLAFRVTRIRLILASIFVSIALISGTISLVFFTSFKKLIPGYSPSSLEQRTIELVYRLDSLEIELNTVNKYSEHIKRMLKGDDNYEIPKDTIDSLAGVNLNIELDPSQNDIKFREEVEQEDRYNINSEEQELINIVLFSPLTGVVTQKYEAKIKHFAIDIAAKEGTPIKAIADGTVIFSEWSADTGYVIILKHSSDFISIYKHNGNLNKSQGDLVESGEVIASVGSTGEYTTGSHLHFELWTKGYPVNPMNFIDFE
ncbi:MAG: M23 family metallopeptidase [Flavobacteriaceae bacterium]|nr:M23 family metallopeptidase [Flavobacteriaceae bacterium]